MTGLGLLTAVLLGALPCSKLPSLEQRLAKASRAGEASWSKALKATERSFAPIPIAPPSDDADETNSKAPAKGRDKAESWVKARLDSICAVQLVPAKTALPDRDRLKQILARPEFAHQSGARIPWWERILDRIGHWLGWLFGTRGAQGFAHVTRALVLGGAALVALFAAWRVLRKLSFRRRTEARAHAGTAPLRLDAPEDHLARSRAALERDPREAIRQSLFALLSWLERRRWARPDRVKTNLEMLRELPSRGAPSEVASRIAPLVRWYDQAFYSLSPVDPAQARDFVEHIARISEAA